MKTTTLLLALASLNAACAATTINSANKFAYGANIGWMDWRGDMASGAVAPHRFFRMEAVRPLTH